MYSCTLPSTLALDEGVWSTPQPGRITPRKDPVPIVLEAGWAPRPLWTGEENFASTEIRSRDRQVRSESLYRLSYPAPRYTHKNTCFFLMHVFVGNKLFRGENSKGCLTKNGTPSPKTYELCSIH